MKIPCLVLDHDDTVVASTPSIHYPTFMKTLEVLRPDIHWTLEEYMGYNFEPGFEPLCYEILKFTPEEMQYQESLWRKESSIKHPPMFDGMAQLLKRYKEAGGMICVISHSSEEVIAGDYQRICGFIPDHIYGWDRGEGHRKPDPWPLRDLIKTTGFAPEQMLMVDDMKPGWKMAHACGVPFAFAGWGNPSSVAHEFMKEHADYSFDRVEQFAELLDI